MLGYARALLLVGLLTLPTSVVLADTQGVFLPPAPRGPGGEDSIETANGTRCRQSINSNGAYLDMGAAGNANSTIDTVTPSLNTFSRDEPDRTGLVYVRITIPLGKRPQRIDCSRLYEMEIIRLRQELELLKMAAE